MCLFAGAALALNDLLGGQIPLIWASPVAVMPFVEQGKVKALAVSTQQRDRLVPQLPTVAESAVPNLTSRTGLASPRPPECPLEVIARVGHAIHEISELSSVRSHMATLGFNLDLRNSDQFREMIIRDHQKYGTIIHDSGIQPD